MPVNINIQLNSTEEIIFFVSNIIVMLSVFAIFLAVMIDFTEFQKRKDAKREKKSIVETGSMVGFFFVFYAMIRFGIGRIEDIDLIIKYFSMFIGSLLVIIGCIVNIIGRLKLGSNWANQIKIYDDHKLITNSVFGWVRHPLYASIIWMFFGASFIYLNYSSFLLNVFIFIPFMYYRAKQEEKLLNKEFGKYKDYQTKVGMFFPKGFKKYEKL